MLLGKESKNRGAVPSSWAKGLEADKHRQLPRAEVTDLKTRIPQREVSGIVWV